MYVKALKLAGFKSFADPTILEFEPGVNVIVGPNGSGKSNISDALSWVLGSQAPSTLRGASMEDVIFAGSQSRKRLGLAEVELTLDNASGLLPLDLAEVTISRLTDRSGQSEYRINGAPCRLLDVAELLSDTGIGRTLHAVVGQGQLDAILQARAEDRRQFIEEAAQIGKYRRRKDRSLKKIERVDDNLLRLNDVLLELRRTLRPLKRQANAAAMYSELLAEQRTIRQRLATTEVARLTARGAQVDPDAEAHRGALLADELNNVRARLAGAAEERRGLVDAAEGARQTAHRMARATDRLAGLRRLASERAEKVAARLSAETEEGYRERIKLLEAERSRWRAEEERLSSASDRLARTATEATAAAAALRSEREAADKELSRARAEETAAAQALVRAEGAEAAGRATLGSIEARVLAVRERREVTQHEVASDVEAVAKAGREIELLEAELDAKTEQAAFAEVRHDAARDEAEGLKQRLGTARADRAAAAARLRAFEEVQALFVDEKTIIDRLRPLVHDARTGARLASADEAEAGRILATAEDKAEAAWREVATQDEELRRLDALMAGAAERLAGVRRRREQHEIEVAALDEELARAQESLAAAERTATEERAALPARRAAVDEARDRREGAEGAMTAARALEHEADAAATDAAMDARSAEEKVLAAQLRSEEAESGIGDAEAALAGLEDLRAALRRQRDAAEQISYLAQDAAARGERWTERAEAHAADAREHAETVERQVAQLRARERELGSGLEEVARKRSEAEVVRAETRARLDAIEERSIDEWGLRLEDLARLETLREDQEADARSRSERLEREMRRMGPVNPNAAEEFGELSDREEFLIDQIEDLKSSRRDLMKVVREVDETILQVFGEAYEAVAREFGAVFQRLFPGGSGGLKLTNPDDLLTSGIEIDARPPGKNVRKLSLLSGGERSLVALAFLFAIFRARPSPFYLLDEVEAALDDVNLQRFLTLIEELERHAQVMIVTHQKRTMESADVLYGVSMNKDGVSLVVAKRMEEVVV
jgi:chromosome segregation protein